MPQEDLSRTSVRRLDRTSRISEGITIASRGDSVGAKFIRYLAFGGSAAAVDLGLFLLFLWFGMTLGPAAALAFVLAVSANYLFCSWFVYTKPLAGWRFALFLLTALLGLVINAGITVAAVGLGAAAALAKIAGIGVAFLFNFTVNTLFVFERSMPRPARPASRQTRTRLWRTGDATRRKPLYGPEYSD